MNDPKAKVVTLERVCAGRPIPNDFVEQVERVMADARLGKVTSFAWVAIGPDFARWENAYLAGRSDRLNILGQLEVLKHEVAVKEIDSVE